MLSRVLRIGMLGYSLGAEQCRLCFGSERGRSVSESARQMELQIGPRIRELRLERGMTLDELAKSAGISASHLSRLERGQAEPSFTVAAAIAMQVGVSLSDLIPENRS